MVGPSRGSLRSRPLPSPRGARSSHLCPGVARLHHIAAAAAAQLLRSAKTINGLEKRDLTVTFDFVHSFSILQAGTGPSRRHI